MDHCPHPLRVNGLNQPSWKDFGTFSWPTSQPNQNVIGVPNAHVSSGQFYDREASLGTGLEMRGSSSLEMEKMDAMTTSYIQNYLNILGTQLSFVSSPVLCYLMFLLWSHLASLWALFQGVVLMGSVVGVAACSPVKFIWVIHVLLPQ